MKTSALISRKQTGESIPSVKRPCRGEPRQSAYLQRLSVRFQVPPQTAPGREYSLAGMLRLSLKRTLALS